MLQYAHLPAIRCEIAESLASCNLERNHSSLCTTHAICGAVPSARETDRSPVDNPETRQRCEISARLRGGLPPSRRDGSPNAAARIDPAGTCGTGDTNDPHEVIDPCGLCASRNSSDHSWDSEEASRPSTPRTPRSLPTHDFVSDGRH